MDLSSVFSALDKSCESAESLELVTNELKNLTLLLKSDSWRSALTEAHWQISSKLAKTALQILNKPDLQMEECQFLAELFRSLRNSCAGSYANHQFLINTPDIYGFAQKTLTKLAQKNYAVTDEEAGLKVLRCCLQLFGNLVSQSIISTKIAVWNLFIETDSFRQLLQNSDLKVQEYTMMVLYNSMTEDNASQLIDTVNGHIILITLTDSLCNNVVDWGILFIELMLKNDDFMERCYNILPMRNRLLVLDIIAEQLDSVLDDTLLHVSKASVHYIKSAFTEFAMNVVQICDPEVDDLKPVEIVKLLSLLCTASVLDVYNSDLKSNGDLLEVTVDVLKSIHLLGKKSCNAFSAINALSETATMSKKEIEGHPLYGFKKDLIRLIGNLCYGSKENQDLCRKLDGIPLLLDCCNLDARNPFILQWCIFAVRNVLEKNRENQEVLASISVTGDLVDSSLLRELGFEVQTENEKVVLRSVKRSS